MVAIIIRTIPPNHFVSWSGLFFPSELIIIVPVPDRPLTAIKSGPAQMTVSPCKRSGVGRVGACREWLFFRGAARPEWKDFTATRQREFFVFGCANMNFTHCVFYGIEA